MELLLALICFSFQFRSPHGACTVYPLSVRYRCAKRSHLVKSLREEISEYKEELDNKVDELPSRFAVFTVGLI